MTAMVSLDPLINAELNMGAAQDFDGISPINLTAGFGAEVDTNFGIAAQTISDGMSLG